jgi:UDP-N-acetylmuramate dehydrogenase
MAPVLTYGDLTRLDPQTVTPQQVFDAVCHMRMTKLPDPKINGNAGSFFKNPIVSAQVAEALLAQFPMHRTIRRQMAASSWPLAG